MLGREQRHFLRRGVDRDSARSRSTQNIRASRHGTSGRWEPPDFSSICFGGNVRGAVTLQTVLTLQLSSIADVVRNVSVKPRFSSERPRPFRPCSLSASSRVCKLPPTRDRCQSPWQVRRFGARLRRAVDASLQSSGTPQSAQQTSERRAEGLRTVPRIARRAIAIAGCCDGWPTLRPGVSLGEPVENYGDHFDEAIRLTPVFSPGFSFPQGNQRTVAATFSRNEERRAQGQSVSLTKSSTSSGSVTLMLRASVRFW
jgi:hypothetical protein